MCLKNLISSRLTSTLEEYHDVCTTSVDLFEVQWDDVTVDLEGLSNGCIHLMLGQFLSVMSDPV